METTLKQRLIGAAVIIALAVIFVPMILDGSGREESVALNMEIPPEPTFTFDSQLPDPKSLDELPPINTSEKNTVETTPADEKLVETKSSKEKPEDDNQAIKHPDEKIAAVNTVVEATENHVKTNPALSAWAVQVAAFAEQDKAVALQEKLLASNLSAFTEQTGKGNKVIYRVKVGPELKRENAEKLRDKIEKEHNLKDSFVTNHP